MVEVVLVAGVVLLAERAYQAYKAGKLVSDVTGLVSTLKNEVANIESKTKAGITVVESDVTAVVNSAKLVFTKLGL